MKGARYAELAAEIPDDETRYGPDGIIRFPWEGAARDHFERCVSDMPDCGCPTVDFADPDRLNRVQRVLDRACCRVVVVTEEERRDMIDALDQCAATWRSRPFEPWLGAKALQQIVRVLACLEAGGDRCKGT